MFHRDPFRAFSDRIRKFLLKKGVYGIFHRKQPFLHGKSDSDRGKCLAERIEHVQPVLPIRIPGRFIAHLPAAHYHQIMQFDPTLPDSF